MQPSLLPQYLIIKQTVKLYQHGKLHNYIHFFFFLPHQQHCRRMNSGLSLETLTGRHYFPADSNLTERPGTLWSAALMLIQMLSWHGRGGWVGSGELVTKTALFPWRGVGGGGAAGALKNHRTQQLNPIPLILAGMPRAHWSPPQLALMEPVAGQVRGAPESLAGSCGGVRPRVPRAWCAAVTHCIPYIPRTTSHLKRLVISGRVL